MLTKIINEETKECLIINQELAKANKELKDYEVDFSYDGKMYLKGYAPKRPIEDLKKEKLNVLEYRVAEYYNKYYPEYKQRNIAIFGTEEEKRAFKLFHDNISLKYYEFKEEVEKAESEEELNKIFIVLEIEE